MSRSRNIKPGFFENEILAGMPYEYRLLFIGLWTMADREGRFEDRPTRVKMKLFAADSLDVNAGLQALHDAGFIQRYEVDGSKYCQVLAWGKHQSPHFKEQKSTIPAPVKPDASTGLSPAYIDGKASGKTETCLIVAALIPDSLIPDSLQEISTPNGVEGETVVSPRDDVPVSKIIELYHEKLPELPRVEKITKTRRGLIRQRWLQKDLPTLDAWANYFQDIRGSPFLMGRAAPTGDRPPFIADIEFLSRPSSFAKIAEGKYHR